MSAIKLSDQANEGQAPGLGDVAYREMKERLIRGEYKPGKKLTVRAVAEDLGFSSTPARDAINRLTGEGALVYSGPKTVIVPVLNEDSLREITLIRLALEGLAAQLAVNSVTNEDIEKLKDIQNYINDALDRRAYETVLRHNKDFHFHVYGIAGMPRLLSMIEGAWLRVGPSLYDLYPEFAEEKYGVRNHQLAIESLEDKDGASLRAAFENDIRDGYRRLRQAARARSSAR